MFLLFISFNLNFFVINLIYITEFSYCIVPYQKEIHRDVLNPENIFINPGHINLHPLKNSNLDRNFKFYPKFLFQYKKIQEFI